MNKIISTITIVLCVFQSYAQRNIDVKRNSNKVMTLGVFHFAYRNLDVHQTDEEDQIPITGRKAQDEILNLVEALKEFQPTKIAVEVDPSNQKKLDSLFNAYKLGNHKLEVDEVQQIGFRLAKQMGHNRLYCTNDWGKHYEKLKFIYDSKSQRTKRFAESIKNNPDSIYFPEVNFVYSSVLAQLIDINDPRYLEKRLGAYLTGVFKYEEVKGDFLGVDFESGRWFNRNLRIFRNIQRITTSKNERILVIYGKDHMNLLNVFFRSSPEYELVSPLKSLKVAKQRSR